MLLSDIFRRDRIIIDLSSRTKSELFRELVSFLSDCGAIEDQDKVMDALLQRESMSSTLVSPNIALPHASLWSFNDTIGAFGISRQGIDYGAPDGKPVHVVMLLIDDKYDSDQHLTIMRESAKLIAAPNFLSKIMECTDPDTVHRLITTLER